MDTESEKIICYGELVVLGYNGLNTIWNDGAQKGLGQPSCRLRLFKRRRANGVVQCGVQFVKAPKQSKIVQDDTKHSISFTLSKSQAVVVEYAPDTETDMFQIGRSSEAQIDFTVVDTWLGVAKNAEQVQHSKLQSTISRYACRILVDREPPHEARLYAAGFDGSRNIFLGEKAAKWQKSPRSVDGLTTNGILILHPTDGGAVPPAEKGGCSYVWREVSVGGDIYSLRETRSAAKRGYVVENETNVLTDGTLIDLCGATLLYRSAEGIEKTPTRKQLESRIDELNAGRPQCPVNLHTLVIPRGRHGAGGGHRAHAQPLNGGSQYSNASTESAHVPVVYLGCGHVQGRHNWGHRNDDDCHMCPLCYTESDKIIQLSVGMESMFYLDSERPNYAFIPCGHMASERTVRYWCRIPMPQGSSSFSPVCPFCTHPLRPDLPFLKLIFQDFCD